jgi:hypothetical protein
MYKFVELDEIDKIKIEILKQLSDNYLNSTTLFYIDNHKEIFSSIDILKNSLVKLGIFDYIVGYGFYVARPFFTGSIHLDNGNYDYSLNIPLLNCEKSQVCFYECSSEPIVTDVVNDSNIKIKFNKFEKQYCTKINSFYFTEPCIIPVKVPHNVININNTIRVSFLIRLGNGYILN